MSSFTDIIRSETLRQVFPLRHLECFYEDEIERLLCGEGETWCACSAAEAHGCSFLTVACLLPAAASSPLEPPKRRNMLGITTRLSGRRCGISMWAVPQRAPCWLTW